MKEPELIYLAGPYSQDPDAMFKQHMRHAALLMAQSIQVFSPILHCHPVAGQYSMPTDFSFWEAYNLNMLKRCDKLYVMDIPGWDKSTGVKGEIFYARQLDIPVYLYNTNGTVKEL